MNARWPIAPSASPSSANRGLEDLLVAGEGVVGRSGRGDYGEVKKAGHDNTPSKTVSYRAGTIASETGSDAWE
ncbi:hypothetical protein N7470_010417 [Penicillium chermesinum]|nr:hypothetical protein N7470_010417 [Penicillium chermesinum]